MGEAMNLAQHMIEHAALGVTPADDAETVTSSTVRQIVVLTQAQYDALTTPESTTLYVITE